MRLRNIPNAYDRLELSENYIQEPKKYKGQWEKYFGNHNPVHIEIGSGKGKFITALALKNPHINYVALERFPAVLFKLIKKIPQEGYKNLAVISFDAQELEEIFISGEVGKVYLNFSDPWPKKRHAKRRLTSPEFLKLYKKILSSGSEIEFKTDNRDLFDYSVEEFKNAGYTLKRITYDLYKSDMIDENIPTEYEEKFHGLGTSINKLVATYEYDKAAKEVHLSDIQAQK